VPTIAHISDLHFGREDPAVAAGLLAELDGTAAPRPSLVAVSGDLTQRARPDQLCAARDFLDLLPVPYVVVPGNHDVPLYDLVARFFRPLERYRRYLGEPLMPLHVDDEMAVIGVTTAHGFTFKGGRITRETADAVRDALAPIDVGWKILVAHHPFGLPKDSGAADRVLGGEEAIPVLEEAGVEIILTGHLHVAFSSDPTAFRSDDRAIIQVHAGTSMSVRRRGEPNGYNLVTIDGDDVEIAHRVWDGGRFVTGSTKSYRRAEARAADAAPRFIATEGACNRMPL
jgi:3',5'-cyclic AMP phosphodiesterase CpdA